MKLQVPGGWTYVLMFLLAALPLGGCSSYPDYGSLPKETPVPKPSGETYRIQSGDVLDIRFPYTEKHNTQATVRPDGKIFIDIAGEVQAAGKRPVELAEHLQTVTSGRLRNPEVIIKVAQSSQKVFVGGEVESEGQVPFRDDLTPIQAITERGGFKDTADLNRLYVVKIRDNTAKITEINLSQTSSMYLSANDVIFIPKSGVAKANLAIEQYVRNMLPFDWIRFW